MLASVSVKVGLLRLLRPAEASRAPGGRGAGCKVGVVGLGEKQRQAETLRR